MRPPISVFRVVDRSMEPTLHSGDYVLANGWFGRLSQGDIVVLRHPARDILMIKRVSKLLDGRCYVVGDNAGLSQDSRSFGAVDMSMVVGKVFFIAKR